MYYVFYRQYFREEYAAVEANSLDEAMEKRFGKYDSPEGDCIEHQSYSVYKSKESFEKRENPLEEDIEF